MYGLIGTWAMAQAGVAAGALALAAGQSAGRALVTGIQAVEQEPTFGSVGYGGLPNAAGVVELDAAYMNGDNFQLGAVGGVQDVASPIELAKQLAHERVNNFLVGAGAAAYADEHHLARRPMLTAAAAAAWRAKRAAAANGERLTPYDGHDTVGMVALDAAGHMRAGTSTSGLFMKHPGRVGDSPLPGAGYYVDSEIGGVVATGLGEDMMKAPLSFATVAAMGRGLSPQAALDSVVYPFIAKLRTRNGAVGEFSYIALDAQGHFGAASNVAFQFWVQTATTALTEYLVTPQPSGRAELRRAKEA
ncbi:isoaspartyl peptidase/L-asparaginase [Lacticaseibacillus nasuensis]|uniref:isoaspartyl peptidase/L-asparaginase n=1 Tax=Lacticaseibacillus nasuensis TaxID=944671 RepID=UPI002247F442|nr:isoaspartyl peptidase/L-asparaginase [Lacticaseibacillus nasuensis]MCX2455472.1 isoaspartyl peptidase/L-asparaginase [Lacticaseibacillus nasuensis]